MKRSKAKRVRKNPLRVALSDDRLDISPSSGAGPKAAGDSSRKSSVVGEVRAGANRVEIAGDLRVRFIGERSIECSRPVALGERIAAARERCGEALRSAATLQVREDWISETVLLRELGSAELGEDLELIADIDAAADVEIALS